MYRFRAKRSETTQTAIFQTSIVAMETCTMMPPKEKKWCRNETVFTRTLLKASISLAGFGVFYRGLCKLNPHYIEWSVLTCSVCVLVRSRKRGRFEWWCYPFRILISCVKSFWWICIQADAKCCFFKISCSTMHT